MDPRFPLGGDTNLVGGGHSRHSHISKIFVCQNERIGNLGGGGTLAAPLGSANGSCTSSLANPCLRSKMQLVMHCFEEGFL